MSVDAASVREDIREYLEKWHERVKAKQLKKGIIFKLSFDDFLQIWGKRRIESLTRWKDDGSLYVRMRRSTEEDPNPDGYVVTWVSFSAKQLGIMDLTTAQVCTRRKSEMDIRMKKGDKHSPATIKRISKTKTGRSNTKEHNDNISAAMIGMKRRPMTDAEKADKREKALAYHARKRAEREAATLGGKP